MIIPSQKPLPDNTQHPQQKNIHAPGGIRTHNLSRRSAVDLRLRPRGHWDWQLMQLQLVILFSSFITLALIVQILCCLFVCSTVSDSVNCLLACLFALSVRRPSIWSDSQSIIQLVSQLVAQLISYLFRNCVFFTINVSP